MDVIEATSYSQSASIDHGHSLIYEICQHLRNGEPLPEAWRIFIEQSDVKVDLSGCPMAAMLEKSGLEKSDSSKNLVPEHMGNLGQPLLQTVFPYFLLGLVIFTPLNYVLLLKESKKLLLHWLLSADLGFIRSSSCISLCRGQMGSFFL